MRKRRWGADCEGFVALVERRDVWACDIAIVVSCSRWKEQHWTPLESNDTVFCTWCDC